MSANIQRLSELTLRQYIGPDARACLEQSDLTLPERDFETVAQGEGFVARLGDEDWLVANLAVDVTLSTRCWAFERSDGVFAIQGDGTTELMQQLCARDLQDIEPGDWQMCLLAGIEAWIYAPRAAPQRLVVGCDPSYERYLGDTLTRVARDLPSGETTAIRG